MPDYLLDPNVCGIKGCDKKAVALGLCVNHWRRCRKYGSPLARKSHSGMFKGLTADERFELQVIRRPGCWGWKGARDQDGYPIFRAEIDNVLYQRGHRFSYVRSTGLSAKGRHVCHTCDNPICTNPAHLFLGSNAENMADKIAKGRSRAPKGEESGKAKICEAQARAILLDPRPYHEIGEEYGLTPSAIGSIKNRESWRHVDGQAVKGRHRGNARQGVSDKLTPGNIREIRASSETGKALAERFGVTQQTICDIRKKRSWKHVD